MKTILVTSIFLSSTLPSQAQGIVVRQKIATEIVKIKKSECGNETKEVKEKISLAASYILHGERPDMTAELTKSKGLAKGLKCKTALQRFLDK